MVSVSDKFVFVFVTQAVMHGVFRPLREDLHPRKEFMKGGEVDE